MSTPPRSPQCVRRPRTRARSSCREEAALDRPLARPRAAGATRQLAAGGELGALPREARPQVERAQRPSRGSVNGPLASSIDAPAISAVPIGASSTGSRASISANVGSRRKSSMRVPKPRPTAGGRPAPSQRPPRAWFATSFAEPTAPRGGMRSLRDPLANSVQGPGVKAPSRRACRALRRSCSASARTVAVARPSPCPTVDTRSAPAAPPGPIDRAGFLLLDAPPRRLDARDGREAGRRRQIGSEPRGRRHDLARAVGLATAQVLEPLAQQPDLEQRAARLGARRPEHAGAPVAALRDHRAHGEIGHEPARAAVAFPAPVAPLSLPAVGKRAAHLAGEVAIDLLRSGKEAVDAARLGREEEGTPRPQPARQPERAALVPVHPFLGDGPGGELVDDGKRTVDEHGAGRGLGPVQRARAAAQHAQPSHLGEHDLVGVGSRRARHDERPAVEAQVGTPRAPFPPVRTTRRSAPARAHAGARRAARAGDRRG